MLPDIHKLVDEFERLSLDEKMYLTFKNEDELEAAVQYDRGQGNRCWQVWLREAPVDSRQTCSRQHLPAVLKAFRLSERDFVREVAGRLLTQAAFADEFVREVKEFLGDDAVRESIRNTQDFMDALRGAVQNALGDKAPDLAAHAPQQKAVITSLAKTSPADTTVGRGKFRIIKS